MAGTITSDLTAGLIDAADAVGTWLTVGTAWSAVPVDSTDIYLQGTAAINANAKNSAGIGTRFCSVATPAALNLTTLERHLFFWIKVVCIPALESRVRGGLGIYISSDTTPTLDSTVAIPWDGPTNSKVWFVSGKDFEPTSGWVCYVVDPTGTPDQTLGIPAMDSVDRAGIRAATLLAVGGGAVKPKPWIWDKMAYGTGLTIIDGTAGTPATFTDIYAADSSVTNSFGVLTQTGGIYYVAGKFLFGTTGQTALTYFKDTSQVIVFQNFPVAATFYEIKLVGNTSPNITTVQFGNYSGGLTSGGLTIRGTSLVERRAIAPVIVSGGTAGTYVVGDILTISGGTFVTAAQIKVITVSAGVITVARMETAGKYSVPPTGNLDTTGGGGTGAKFTLTFVGGSIWTLTASAANQTLNLYGCTLSEMKSAALASTTSVRGCSITNSGAVTSNSATIDNCTFQDVATATPISGVYALIINSTAEMALVTNSKFINCNRAIKITAAGTYTFSNLTFSGNTYDIDNSSTGAVLIDRTNGANPTTFINSNAVNTGLITINVAAVGTFTRTTGNYTTDGFTNGMAITTSGFTGGNNTTKVISTITGSGTIITVTSATGLADETGGGDEKVQAGSTTINPLSVNLTITVKDQEGVLINTAQVAVYKTSDNTQLMNEYTGTPNPDGVATQGFSYLTDTPVYYRIRKSSTGDTKYIPASGTGTITASGLTVTVTLFVDPNA